ncbi:hypothetical protein [Paenibacillus sp. 203]|uniref:hypothetical protein n=1 Tax=Paenibacillus sp. 203 TaxID=3096765 RepID=UPI003008612E
METNYRKLLDQMMTPYDEMLQSLIGNHADFSKVDYLEKHSEKYGKSDANYTNRLKVLLAMYNREDRYAPHYEPIVRRLLVNEIIDRGTNSFQGIGDALYYAVFLLQGISSIVFGYSSNHSAARSSSSSTLYIPSLHFTASSPPI